MFEVNENNRRLLKQIFEDQIPFNQFLGLSLDVLATDHASVSFSLRPELLGNTPRGMLHGGVIAAVLDATGGVMAYLVGLNRSTGQDPEIRLKGLERISTVDMRVDYLRPGVGERFTATAAVLRAGQRVAVIRSELHNQEAVLIAAATCSYMLK